MTPKPFDPIFFLNPPTRIEVSPEAVPLIQEYVSAYAQSFDSIVNAIILSHLAHTRESLKQTKGDSFMVGFVSSRVSSPALPMIYVFDMRHPETGQRTTSVITETEYVRRMQVVIAEIPRENMEWIGGSPDNIPKRT